MSRVPGHRLIESQVRAGNLLAEHLYNDLQIRQDENGTHATASFVIGDLRGDTFWDRLSQALRHRSVPRLGDFNNPAKVPVRELSVEMLPESSSQAKVSVAWGPAQLSAGPTPVVNDPDDEEALPQFEYHVSIDQQALTVNPVTGEQLVVTLPAEEGPLPGGEQPEGEQSQIGEFNMPVLMETVIARRIERTPPGVKSRKFTGSINGDTVFGSPPRTWLAVITGGSNNNGQTWLTEYQLQGNLIMGWDALIPFRGNDGRVHDRVVMPSLPRDAKTGLFDMGGTSGVILVDRAPKGARPWRGKFGDNGMGLPDFFWNTA